ncbi:MAG: phenylacetate--CoA ligase family protein [Limisphaerales bacterium]|jgi:phenylacetate-CoA ligase|nr:phenylacetate--CoA ligase [Verrucomicrobiota bacterium]
MASNTVFNPISAPDYLPPERLKELQAARLRQRVSEAYEKVPFFRAKMEALNVVPGDIQKIEDIAKLPFSVKKDLRDTYPFGLFAEPMNKVVRVHASSGTTGKPIVVGYNQRDVDVWKEVVVRGLVSAGIGADDVVQVSYGYGLFTGGLGLHYGAEALGATVVPASGGNTHRQVMLMKDFGVTVICCTPSYFIHLIDRAEAMGIDMKALALRFGIFGAEPWTQEMRRYIEAHTSIKALDIYGLSEIVGPGVAMECAAREGSHIFEDHFYPEIIDPESGEVLPDGEEGELVLTTLSKEAMPMMRYRTRDITSLDPGQCSCGRTLRRIRRITSRSDDMFIIRGVNVYPSQIETALLSIEGTLPHYQIILRRENNLDTLEVQVEINANLASDTVSGITALEKRIAKNLEQIVGIHAIINLVQPETLQRSEGKIQRVSDLRNLNPGS